MWLELLTGRTYPEQVKMKRKLSAFNFPSWSELAGTWLFFLTTWNLEMRPTYSSVVRLAVIIACCQIPDVFDWVVTTLCWVLKSASWLILPWWLWKRLRGIEELDTEEGNTSAFTSWPLGVTAFSLFAFSQLSALCDKGLMNDSTVQQHPVARKQGSSVDSFCIKLYFCFYLQTQGVIFLLVSILCPLPRSSWACQRGPEWCLDHSRCSRSCWRCGNHTCKEMAGLNNAICLKVNKHTKRPELIFQTVDGDKPKAPTCHRSSAAAVWY